MPGTAAWQLKINSVTQISLRSFDNLSRFDAAGAHLHTAVTAVRKLDANRLQIRVETPPGFIVGVRNVITKLRPFAAYITSLSHNIAPLSEEGSYSSYKNSKRIL